MCRGHLPPQRRSLSSSDDIYKEPCLWGSSLRSYRLTPEPHSRNYCRGPLAVLTQIPATSLLCTLSCSPGPFSLQAPQLAGYSPQLACWEPAQFPKRCGQVGLEALRPWLAAQIVPDGKARALCLSGGFQCLGWNTGKLLTEQLSDERLLLG